MSALSTIPTKANGPLERAAGGATGQRHNADVSADRDESKIFATLRAKFAIVGHTLYKTVNPDGTVIYIAGKWGLLRELKTLEVAAAFLVTIGGRV